MLKKTETRERKALKYPLKSLVFCGNCGRRMTRTTGCGFFRCQNGSALDEVCRKNRSPKESEMEEAVLRAIRNYMGKALPKGAGKMRAAGASKGKETFGGESLDSLKRKADSLRRGKLEEYERYCDGVTNKETYLERKARISAVLEECEAAISRAEDELAEKARSQGLRSEAEAVCGAFKGEEKLTYEMAHAFVEKVIVKPERGLEIVWRFKDVFQTDVGGG